jgi:hypothetical protein
MRDKFQPPLSETPAESINEDRLSGTDSDHKQAQEAWKTT